MKMPERVEMELTTGHPFLPGGFSYLFMSEKDSEEAMKDCDMHYVWESPFYQVNDKMKLQLVLDVEEHAKSKIGAKIFNSIRADLVALPLDQDSIADITEKNVIGYNKIFDYGISQRSYLEKWGKISQDVGFNIYMDGRFMGVQIDGPSEQAVLKEMVCIPPSLGLYFLDRAEHKTSGYSKERNLSEPEKESFYINREIAKGRMRKHVNGNNDLSQIVDNILRNK